MNTVKLPRLTGDYHRVGGGYSVQFTTRKGQLQCEWAPHVPSTREMRRKVDKARYESARNSFVKEMGRQLRPQVDGVVVVVDTGSFNDE